MFQGDRKTFAAAMTRLFAIYRDELTDHVLDAWWGVLDEYSVEDVMQAMSCHATDPERGSFRPVPADIVRHLTVTLPKRTQADRNRTLRLESDRTAPHINTMYLAINDERLGLIDAKKRDEILEREKATIAQIKAEVHGPALTHDSYPSHDPR